MPRSLSSSRMEAFSDGVFSIAATLLVLDIALDSAGYAARTGPPCLAWVPRLRHQLLDDRCRVARSQRDDRPSHPADSLLLRINLLLLLVVAFLPFPTKLVAEGLHDTSGERVFVTLYGLTLLTIRLLSFALDAYARHEKLYAHDEADAELQAERRDILPVLGVYVLAILIGLAVPRVAVALYFALAVFLVVPFRDVRRLISRRP